MPTLDWLNREAAFRTAAQVPTRVLRPHRAAPATIEAAVGDDGAHCGNLLIQGETWRCWPRWCTSTAAG